jgi:hypothetical protein
MVERSTRLWVGAASIITILAAIVIGGIYAITQIIYYEVIWLKVILIIVVGGVIIHCCIKAEGICSTTKKY